MKIIANFSQQLIAGREFYVNEEVRICTDWLKFFFPGLQEKIQVTVTDKEVAKAREILFRLIKRKSLMKFEGGEMKWQVIYNLFGKDLKTKKKIAFLLPTAKSLAKLLRMKDNKKKKLYVKAINI